MLAAALGLVIVVSLMQGVSVRNALVLARARLDEAEAAARTGDLDAATASLQTARSHTGQAARTLDGPAFGVLAHVPLFGTEVRSARRVLGAASDASSAMNEVLGALGQLNVDGDVHAGLDVGTAVGEADRLRPTIRRTLSILRTARRRATDARPRTSAIKSAQSQLLRGIEQINEQAGAALGLLDLGDAVISSGRPLRLLLLGQDSWELRPTGGFIGSWGILELSGGRMRLERYEDATTLPGSALEAPYPLSAALDTAWRLTGVGWWSNFPDSARRAQEMIREVAGADVDGVVALTQHAVEGLIDVVGPVEVPGYDETVTSKNVADRILYHVELKRPRDVPRKRFLSTLATVVFDRLSELQGRAAVSFLNAIATTSQRRDAQVWFADEKLQRTAEAAGLGGVLRRVPGGEDFLSVVDANIGIDKANRDVRTSIAYSLRRDGQALVGEVRVSTRNRGPASMFNQGYHSFLRVVVPDGAEWLGDADRRLVTIGTDGPYRTFGLGAVVPVGDTVTRVFRYRLPPTITATSYRLTYQGQSGVSAPVSITIRTGSSSASASFESRSGPRLIGAR